MKYSHIAACALVAALSAAASATPVTFSGTSGNRSASASFSVTGTTLTVKLTNTSLSDALVPTDILTGLFFNSSSPFGSLGDAMLGAGATVLHSPLGLVNGTIGGNGDVGGEWAFRDDLAGAGQGNANFGISSSGLGLFGAGDRFDISFNLQGPESPDGLQYGLTTAGDNGGTGNSPVTGDFALIQNQVVFTFAVASTFDPSTAISNIWFQYGTDLNEPSFGPDNPIPLPSTAMMAVAGLGLIGIRRRRTA